MCEVCRDREVLGVALEQLCKQHPKVSEAKMAKLFTHAVITNPILAAAAARRALAEQIHMLDMDIEEEEALLRDAPSPSAHRH